MASEVGNNHHEMVVQKKYFCRNPEFGNTFSTVNDCLDDAVNMVYEPIQSLYLKGVHLVGHLPF